ncbi:MAG: DNA polymerase IV [Desulfobacterales bacterium]|nr:DNA polymerase IV [Desulfobacterales bacterium]
MILHVDMDAFFAAVEQRDNPALKGKPVIISGYSKRSVVSTASYEARKYGIHSAMPVFKAKQKCPHVIIQPGSRNKYSRDSKKIMDILRQFSPLVEPVSIDEAFLDVHGCAKLFGSPEQIAEQIKLKIFKELSLTCSIGIAPVRFLAKIASDMNKPDGLTIIPKEKVDHVINNLPIKKVPGVGARAMKQMEVLQVSTLGDIKQLDMDLLNRKFGKMGKRLFELAHGIDRTRVEPTSTRKSISSETTLSKDVCHLDDIRKILLAHAHRVGRDLRAKKWLCRNVSIKIKFSDFTTVTRSKKTANWIASSNAIYDEAVSLMEKVKVKKKIRLIGVGVSDFQDRSEPVQLSLLPDQNETTNRQWESVDKAMDSVISKFGADILKKASLEGKTPRPKFIGGTKDD